MSTLFIEFNDQYFVDVVSTLINKGVKVKYLVTQFPELYKNKSEFSKTRFFDEKKFHYAENINKLNLDNKNSLSQKFIKQNIETENLYLSITDRISFYPKTVRFRKELYYELLLYWKTFLAQKKIKTIVYPRVPHLGYGNIVYQLAKKLKINTVIVRETLLENKSLISNDYLSYKQVPKKSLSRLSFNQLKEKLGEKWLNIVFGESDLSKINYFDNLAVKTQNQKSLFTNLFNKKTIRSLFSLVHFPFSRIFASYTFLEKPVYWWKHYWLMSVYYRNSKKLLNLYRSISSSEKFNKKYIYFALHYQPERTTLPEAGVFENQLLAIDITAKSIPKGWLVYIKEHPNQFARSDLRLMDFRSERFYKKIQQYPNIRFLPLYSNVQTIIKNSQSVVTMTGSTGWEALQLGKPVITFTPAAWYSGCRSVFIATSQKEFRKALSQALKTKKSEVLKDLLKFVLYYKKIFVNAAITDSLAHQSDLSYKQLVRDLADALYVSIKLKFD